MNKIEEYLINKRVKACSEYVSDGLIVLSKKFIENPILKQYKNFDKNIMEFAQIPYERVKNGIYHMKYN